MRCSLKRGWAASHFAHRFMLVGPVVVQDCVQRSGEERAVETSQELQEFLVPMPPVALADDLPGQNVSAAINVVVPVLSWGIVPRRPGSIDSPGCVRSRS